MAILRRDSIARRSLSMMIARVRTSELVSMFALGGVGWSSNNASKAARMGVPGQLGHPIGRDDCIELRPLGGFQAAQGPDDRHGRKGD
jgi:hypothetical protein